MHRLKNTGCKRASAAALTLIAALVVPDAVTSRVQAATVTVDFEDLALAPDSHNNNSLGFSSRGATFNNVFDGTFGVWSGWSYSNEGDATTAGFTNQYSSFAGGGDGSSNFGVATAFPGDIPAYIDLPTGQPLQSVRITNITYAALSMRDGDGFAKKFGGTTGNDADYFKLTINGHQGTHTGSIVGSVEFYLADFRFADNSQDYIIDEWTTVDLTGIVGADALTFELESSDNHPTFGMNTPAYFALDNLVVGTVEAVPEPGGLALLLVGSGVLLCAGVRGRHRS